VADISKERDIETLRQMARLLEVENTVLHEKLQEMSGRIARLEGKREPEQLALEIQVLLERLDDANRRLYGDSSERRPGNKGDTESKPKTGHGPRPQPDLPIREVNVKLADADRVCRSCGGGLEEIEGMTEDSESISFVRRAFYIDKLKKQKYRCQCGGDFRTAAANGPLVPGGRYSVEVAAHIAEQKHLDHVPLDRQRRAMQRQGITVSTSTLWDQLDALADYLEPTYDLLRHYILGADVIGVDETTWRLMTKKPNTKWWVWAMCCPNAVYYGFGPSRSVNAAAQFIGDFKGTVVCDGYKAYETLASRSSELRLALCWAHARRKFVEAEPNYPVCTEAIELIGDLFAIDRDTQNPALLSGDAKLAAAETRQKARADRAPPILEALKDWALTQRGLPKSGLRKAIDYMLKRWQPLQTFLQDPFVPLDNNATERALRGIVIGRKNHLGSRSERGTKVAAIMYTIMETAKLNGLNPFDWVVDAVYRRKADPDATPLPLT